MFSEGSGAKYFKSILSNLKTKYYSTFSSWILKLPELRITFDMTPPSYKEITKAIAKVKARSSSCSFDQINYIMLMQCPILRTMLSGTQDLNRVLENIINTNMLEKRPFSPRT